MQKAKRYSLIAGIVILVLLIIGIVFAAIYNAWLAILYIALIILAAFTLAVTAFQIYTIVMLIRTISTVRDEMKPLLASVQETVDVVKETAKSAGQTAVTVSTAARFTRDFAFAPTIQVTALLLAAQRTIRVFLGRGLVGSRLDQRRRQQMDAAMGGE
jgi:membrane-bound ClpP family serine protease